MSSCRFGWRIFDIMATEEGMNEQEMPTCGFASRGFGCIYIPIGRYEK